MTVDRSELVHRVRTLGPVIAERAVRYDREASFPFENFADFRRVGLLALCVPEQHGGLGASYADYVRVSEEIGRYCGATALTFNMHNATMLWCGPNSSCRRTVRRRIAVPECEPPISPPQLRRAGL